MLEGRTPAARARLERRSCLTLQAWASEVEEGQAGRRVAKPRGMPGQSAPGDGSLAESRRRFILTRGVFGLGLGAGLAWMLTMAVTGLTVPWPQMLLLGFVVFPAVGAVWANWLWKQGRA